MICPSCQTENKEGAKFCGGCGAPLVLALACPRCGASREPEQRFCDECGLNLTAAPPADPAPAARPAPIPHEPAPAAAEMRLVSVLFVDLVGFTTLSESRDAADVRDLLSRYFESARTIVERHGGIVEKFIGDAVMAVWGAPVAREDDAERSVRAALELVDAVRVFGGEVRAPDLRARAGVVTGQVAAVETPGEGLVVGDRVNTASRVQSAAAPDTVLVDEVTHQVTSSAIAYEDAGEHTVKGKSEPLRLWRVLRVVSGVGGHDRREGIEAPFVGRDGDLRLIKELFHGALERRSARLVAVTGDAGIGKSRLRQEFFNYIDGLAGTVLWHSGRCLSYGDGVAYWALAEMVRQRFGIPEEATSEEATAKLRAGLERWVPDSADREFLTPRLGALLGVAEPGLSREELFAGWRMFFERLADHEAVALVFEDLHRADAGLIEFIEQLLDWSAASPIVILTFARPELSERYPGWPAGHRGATMLQLEPLGEDAMRQLLAGVVDGLPAAAADRIVGQAEGVPLYAIETLRALADRGVLSEHGGGLTLEGELGELDVPATLGSLLAARLDALTPDERRLVKAMSVFGGSFPRPAAAALGDVAPAELDGVLTALVRKGILVIRSDRLSPDRGQYAFAQGLLRNVAYETLSRPERKARHLAAAEHLREAFPGDGEDVAEVIATHTLDAYHAAAGDPDQEALRSAAIVALRRAARRSSSVGAPETAEHNYRTAADLATDEAEATELLEAAAAMALAAGSNEAAAALYERAISQHEAAGRSREAARLLAPLSQCLRRTGRAGGLAERIRAALSTLGGSGADELACALNSELGWVLVSSGENDAAEAPLETALKLAAALELPRELSYAMIAKAVRYEIAGRVEEADALYQRAAELAERHDLADERESAQGNAANLRMQWDLPGSEALFEELARGSRRRGNRYREAYALGNVAAMCFLSGRWDQIDLWAADLLDEEPRPFEEFLRFSLGRCQALRGELESARVSLARIRAWEDSTQTEYRAMYEAAVVYVGLAEGRAQAVLDHGHTMVKDTMTTDGPGSDPFRCGWPDVLEAALQCGRLDVARELVALLEALPVGHIPPYMRAQLARGRALTNAAAGDHEAVEADLRRAAGGFRMLAYPHPLASTEIDLAAWLIDRGRPAEADELLAGAEATMSSLRARPALERIAGLRSAGAPGTIRPAAAPA